MTSDGLFIAIQQMIRFRKSSFIMPYILNILFQYLTQKSAHVWQMFTFLDVVIKPTKNRNCNKHYEKSTRARIMLSQ